MSTQLPVLQQISIASPCPASWDDMEGDERVRFCGECKLNVYDLSAMTAGEAARLLLNTDGRLCARFYRRRDGTILTRDCPVGLRAVRRRLLWGLGRAAALLGFVVGAVAASVLGERQGDLADVEPFASLQRWLEPNGPMPTHPRMGRVRIHIPKPPDQQ